MQAPGPRARPDEGRDRVEGHDLAVLSELARDGAARVAFQGLRRRLDLHQQALARALRRLARGGLVARAQDGYQVTAEGLRALRGRSAAVPPSDVVPLLEATLPPGLEAPTVVRHLSQRWFRGLRWYGQSLHDVHATLTWLLDDAHAAVRVHVRGDRLVLEVEAPEARRAEGFAAARGVLAAIAELYGLSAGPGPGVVAAALAGAPFAA